MSKARKLKTLLGIDSHKITSFEGYSGLVYARVSSKRQEVDGTGLSSQGDRCKSELNAMKVPFEKTFPDSYTGGGDFMKRPAMRELLSYIDARPHKKFVVVFDDLKRFARDVEFHLKLRAAFELRDVVLKCLNFTFDETPEGRYSEIIMAGHTELERHQNSRQVVQKQKARLESGYYAFGSKRGYTNTKFPEHGMLAVPNKEGLEILKPALEGFANGTLQRKIDVCRYLVEHGFWTIQKPEKYLDKVTSILKDSFYAGYIEFPAWEVSRRVGQHEGLISIGTFELIQKRLSKTDLNKRVRIEVSPDFELRGLLLCDDCNGHLTGGWYSNGKGQKYRRYICQQDSKCPSYKKVIDAKDIDDKFIEVLKKGRLKNEVSILLGKVFDSVWDKEIVSIRNNEQMLEKQKKSLEQKLSELTDLMLAAKSLSVKRAYEKQIEILADQIEVLEQQPTDKLDLSIPYQTALEKSSLLLKKPDIAWEKLDVFEKQRLFFFLFQEKLPYSRINGYQTSQIPYATRLFEDFVYQNPLMVEQIDWLGKPIWL